jgi:predicted Zn-dependent protease
MKNPGILLMTLLAAATVVAGCRQQAPARAEPAQPKLPPPKRICFVAFADFPSTQIQSLVDYYHEKLKLEVETGPALRIPDNAVDAARQQLIAERLVEGARAARADLAGNPHAVLIAFTDQDIYPLGENWQFAFGWRDETARTAVVSSARMDLHYPDEPADVARPEIRLRKIVTKDIGILYYHLPQNGNPHSVLYNGILGIQELDMVGEDF